MNKVTLTFDSVEVQEYSLETLGKIRETLGPGCVETLKKQKSKRNAYQVVSVIKADVAYKVDFNDDASAEAKEEALTAIGAKVGFNIARSEGVVGKGLYYGVSLEPQYPPKP